MKPPSFPFFPDNWLGSARVASMRPEQEGAYVRLLAYQWQSEDQTIPDCDEDLSAMSRLNGRWVELGAKVKACFSACGSGKLRNERLYCEWMKSMEYRENQARAGRLGMTKRWGQTSLSLPLNGAITPLEQSNNSQSQSQSHTQREREKSVIDSQGQSLTPVSVSVPVGGMQGGAKPDQVLLDFEEVWKLYPDKAGKSKAEVAYRKDRKNGASKEQIADGLKRYIAYVQSKQRGDFQGMKFQNGSTWFYNHGWRDEYTIQPKAQRGASI